jgi:hypothetical protein
VIVAPSAEESTSTEETEWATFRETHNEMLKVNLERAQNKMKSQADKH